MKTDRLAHDWNKKRSGGRVTSDLSDPVRR